MPGRIEFAFDDKVDFFLARAWVTQRRAAARWHLNIANHGHGVGRLRRTEFDDDPVAKDFQGIRLQCYRMICMVFSTC